MSKKGKPKKGKIIILIVLVLVLVGGGIGGYFFYQSKKLKVNYEKKVTVNIHQIYQNTKGIHKIKNGTLLTKTKKLDTSKVGKQKVEFIVKDYFKRKKKFTYELEVVDKEAPKITFNPNLKIEEKNTLDLLNGVSAEDNSKEEIKVTVEGEYDINTPGTYELYYVAKDSSGNEAKEKFQLEVTKKVVVIPKTNTTAAPTVADGNFTTSNGHKGVIKNGITYIDGILIANKTYALPSTYNPGGLTGEFTTHFNQMKSAANAEGVYFEVFSGYRSYNTQVSTYRGWVNKDGQAAADTYSARPGHSEHQSGLAADINGYGARFEESKATEWMANNSYKYGFILRYPKGKQGITGYVYESWHFRYVGVDLATKLYNGGNWITLEEYFGITSQYNY